MFARDEGSVAAPTAGLHFTDELLARLKARGVGLHKVTLHVGAGTFLPVKADDTAGHKMHAEFGIGFGRDGRRRSMRRAPKAGASWRSARPRCGCWKARAGEDGQLRAFSGETAIFITPGYRFRAVDLMLTNFHLPRSTLFMLVAAFSGLDAMKRAYAHAIASRLSLLFLWRCVLAVSGMPCGRAILRPREAGTQNDKSDVYIWIPACAGMTKCVRRCARTRARRRPDMTVHQ